MTKIKHKPLITKLIQQLPQDHELTPIVIRFLKKHGHYLDLTWQTNPRDIIRFVEDELLEEEISLQQIAGLEWVRLDLTQRWGPTNTMLEKEGMNLSDYKVKTVKYHGTYYASMAEAAEKENTYAKVISRACKGYRYRLYWYPPEEGCEIREGGFNYYGQALD